MQNHRMRRRGVALILAAGLGLGSCATEGAGTTDLSASVIKPDAPVTPDVVDLAGLQARLTPSSGEKALLVNFWASW